MTFINNNVIFAVKYCNMKRIELIKGQKFGKLTYIEEAESKRLPSGQINRIAKCLCDCGKTKEVRFLHLVRFRILSCGCIVKKIKGASKNPLSKIWRAIKYRTAENYFERHLYYDKGIKVCDEWLNSCSSFISWSEKNGYKKGLQIDRIDNSKGYSPENCRWVSQKINVNNRDNTFMVYYDGKNQPITLLLEKLGKRNSYYTIRRRILAGWNHQKAIDTPIKEGNYKRKNRNI